MRVRRELAKREWIRAYWQRGQLLLVARGTVPEPCYEVGIDRNVLTDSPTEFILYRWRTALVCPDVVVPFTTFESFPLETQPDSVVVHHEDGRDDLTINDDESPSFAAAELTPLRALAGGEAEGFYEATGMSATMSFDEAFSDAVSRLPEWPPSMPDELSTVTVSEIGAWFGGIAGFHHLVVTVRRPVGGPARGG